ncbi:pinin/SDK/memA/ protein conserved region-domain-containing protein [Durotheca rogersii]|uniref:pinin/SDK/memA/ protein conserved region-domain-containing protein n=1 Tax=Durotheca rogersii TaxID=419775 RepID=UPI00221EA466|nr:pinin/SDK/memA/ protein conserved region-domain-containing protein [Durotheca rogersii]KAI5863165.1 pinin/SDK/memA/ protein conserved region-domain-containing protein [Durotheca rogersii]
MSANESSLNGRSQERETTADEDGDRGSAHKRKASSPPQDRIEPSQSPKRTRLDDDAKSESPSARALPARNAPDPDRRDSALQEEKRRGKRLFGGLLSTLSQTTSSSQQKRRQEIERRQQAKAHQQKVEDDKQKEEKLAKLRGVREAEQLKFDERVMQSRHSNMLATARFLETKSTPKIYYLPWDRTDAQENTIKGKMRHVEEIISKELAEFKERREQKLKALGIAVVPEPPTPIPKDTVGSKPDNERLTDHAHSDPNDRPPSRTHKPGPEKEPDRADDAMIEEEVEDTVIY